MTVQPLVLMNRFIINLRSLSTAGSSQDSSAQHWSRFTAPNFHIPDSFLGNIGEDLQDGHKSANSDLDNGQEIDAVSHNIQSSPETELEMAFTTPGSSIPGPMDAQVSIKRCSN